MAIVWVRDHPRRSRAKAAVDARERGAVMVQGFRLRVTVGIYDLRLQGFWNRCLQR